MRRSVNLLSSTIRRRAVSEVHRDSGANLVVELVNSPVFSGGLL